ADVDRRAVGGEHDAVGAVCEPVVAQAARAGGLDVGAAGAGDRVVLDRPAGRRRGGVDPVLERAAAVVGDRVAVVGVFWAAGRASLQPAWDASTVSTAACAVAGAAASAR